MGFFQELKDNLSQAVNELMPEEGLRETEMTETEPEKDNSTEEESVETSEAVEVKEGAEVSAQEAAFAAYIEGAKKEEAKKTEEEDLAELEAEIARLEAEEALEKQKAEEALKLSETESEIDKALSGISFEGTDSFSQNVNFASEETVREASIEESEPAEEENIKEAVGETVEEPIEDQLMVIQAESETVTEEMSVNEVAVEEASSEETATSQPKEEKTAESSAFVWGARKMDTASRMEAVDETAVITGGMTVNGDITSEGSLNVIGKIIGNVDVYGKLNITGTINGNSRASEIYADSARITGEVCSEGSVKIGQSSVIIGNITATSAVIAGAVKGDIDVKGPVILDTSAIVMGNIKSKSVQINNGAVIEGMCSQCYADVSPSSFFNEFKK